MGIKQLEPLAGRLGAFHGALIRNIVYGGNDMLVLYGFRNGPLLEQFVWKPRESA